MHDIKNIPMQVPTSALSGSGAAASSGQTQDKGTTKTTVITSATPQGSPEGTSGVTPNGSATGSNRTKDFKSLDEFREAAKRNKLNVGDWYIEYKVKYVYKGNGTIETKVSNKYA